MTSPTLMTQSTVAVADVIVRDRLRPVSGAGVESLLASIAEVGVMKDAIHVRKKKDGKLYLIAGGHRLAAAVRLGWSQIEAKVWTDVTDDWARLMEIDDNLAGSEMNALDTAVFLARRKEVYERLHPETKRGGAGALARWDDATANIAVASFALSTAEKFGMSERKVFMLLAAGGKLGPDECTSLRKAPRPVTLKDLTEIARCGEAVERYEVVKALADGTAKSAGEARRAWKARKSGVQPPVKDKVETGFLALAALWSRLPLAARKRFCLEYAQDIWAVQNKGVPLSRWQEATEE